MIVTMVELKQSDFVHLAPRRESCALRAGNKEDCAAKKRFSLSAQT
jgi:hypothetical protein